METRPKRCYLPHLTTHLQDRSHAMKTYVAPLAAAAILLAVSSTASAAWTYYGSVQVTVPAPVVTTYPVYPAYSYYPDYVYPDYVYPSYPVYTRSVVVAPRVVTPRVAVPPRVWRRGVWVW